MQARTKPDFFSDLSFFAAGNRCRGQKSLAVLNNVGFCNLIPKLLQPAALREFRMNRNFWLFGFDFSSRTTIALLGAEILKK